MTSNRLTVLAAEIKDADGLFRLKAPHKPPSMRDIA
jgi:hypothetical protein